MLVKPPIEKLLPRVANRYVLAMVTAKRARQLVDGAQPMASADNENMVTLAAEELADGQISAVNGLVEPKVPLRPEIELERKLFEQEQAEKRREEMAEDSRRTTVRVREPENSLIREFSSEDDAKNIAAEFMRLVAENTENTED